MVLFRCSIVLVSMTLLNKVDTFPTEQQLSNFPSVLDYYVSEEQTLAAPHETLEDVSQQEAVPQAASQGAKHELQDDASHTHNYDFSFVVNDPDTHNFQERQEKREKGVIKGFYSLLEADGSLRLVTYTADDQGFRALVARQEQHTDLATGPRVSATAHD